MNYNDIGNKLSDVIFYVSFYVLFAGQNINISRVHLFQFMTYLQKYCLFKGALIQKDN